VTVVFKPDINFILSGNINVKTYQFKKVFNGDTVYITQLTQQKS